VVTRVGRHYSLGRLTADDHVQTPIESLPGRADALRRAWLLAGAGHRVFVLDNAGSGTSLEFDCAERSTDSAT
jgi:hypothetical protein